jgi:alpha-galactosidase
VEPYAFWSNASQSSLGLGIDIRLKDLDYPALRRLIAAWRRISPDFYGDFYPLTPWTRNDHDWMAWQFDRPESGEGVVQVFRRPESIYETARFKLSGLAANARYRITDLDRPAAPRVVSGAELLQHGLSMTLPEQPDAAVLTYHRLP